MSTLPTRILKEALDNCKLTVGDLRVFCQRQKMRKKNSRLSVNGK